MTTALELWDKLRQQPKSWLPTGAVFAFVLTPRERETVLHALRNFTPPEGERNSVIEECAAYLESFYIPAPGAAALIRQLKRSKPQGERQ